MSLKLPPWPPDWPELESAVVAAVRSGDWGRYQSPLVSELRDRLAERFAVAHVRLTPSGTAGIELALRSVGVQPGDEVILAAYDFPGNFRCVELLGATPVLVDVGDISPALDAGQLAAAVSDKTRAVIASHLFGQPADVAAIKSFCDAGGFPLVEDACQVPGMTIAGRPAGSGGHVGVLSFGGSKTLTAGNGGALLTNDPRLAARWGPLLDRPSDMLALSPLQAAVLLPQLSRLESLNQLRDEAVSEILDRASKRLPTWTAHREQVAAPVDRPSQAATAGQSELLDVPAYYKLAWSTATAQQRGRVVDCAARLGLPIGAGFRSTAGVSPRRCRKPVPLPNSERLSKSVFVLDHQALLVDPSCRPTLIELLVELHDQTSD